MPPASGRSAATAGGTGATKATTTKKAAHIKVSRKSIATDPALLQGSSDEEGEGPQDHEENHGSQRAAQRANYIQRAAQKTSARSTAAARTVEPVNSNSSPRRSTRLSGEGLGMQDQASTATSGGNTRKQPSRSKDQVSSTGLSQSTIPNKRKAPASTKTTNVVGSTHLTPPETDSDNGQGSKPSASQRQASSQSRSPTTKSKRLRDASGAARANTQVC